MDNIDKIFDELNKVDMSLENPDSVSYSKVESTMLCIAIKTDLELKFLQSIITNNESKYSIPLAIRTNKIVKKLGYTDLTYNNLIKIISYNPSFVIHLITNSNKLKLNQQMIIELPREV